MANLKPINISCAQLLLETPDHIYHKRRRVVLCPVVLWIIMGSLLDACVPLILKKTLLYFLRTIKDEADLWWNLESCS